MLFVYKTKKNIYKHAFRISDWHASVVRLTLEFISTCVVLGTVDFPTIVSKIFHDLQQYQTTSKVSFTKPAPVAARGASRGPRSLRAHSHASPPAIASEPPAVVGHRTVYFGPGLQSTSLQLHLYSMLQLLFDPARPSSPSPTHHTPLTLHTHTHTHDFIISMQTHTLIGVGDLGNRPFLRCAVWPSPGTATLIHTLIFDLNRNPVVMALMPKPITN